MTSRFETDIAKSAGLAAVLAMINLAVSYALTVYTPSEAHVSTVFEQLALTTLIFLAMSALEFGFVLAWLVSKQRRESIVWELTSEADRELENIRNNFGRVTADARDQKDLFVEHFRLAIRELAQSLRDAAYRRELRVVCHHFQSVENVMSAFLGERSPLLRYVWILEEENTEQLFADLSWMNYFTYTDDMVRKRDIGEVRALLVVDDMTILEHPSIARLTAFYRNTPNMGCRVVPEERFNVLMAENDMLSGYVDFGIYGNGLVFRTETYEPQTSGVFSKDQDLVTRYTKFFDDVWNSGLTIDNPSDSEDRITADELIRRSTYHS